MAQVPTTADESTLTDNIRGWFQVKHLPMAVTLLSMLLFVWLILVVPVGSFFFSISGSQPLTFGLFLEIFTRVSTWESIGVTLWIAVLAGTFGTGIGFIYVWVIVRTNAPGKRILRILAVTPIALPGIVKTIGWIGMLSPSIGAINRVWEQTFGSILFNIYSIAGIVVAMSVGFVSVSFLIIEPAMRNLGADLEEASRVGGHGPARTFFKVTLPLMLPGIFSAFLINTIHAFGAFEYPLLFGALGTGGTIDHLAVDIYLTVSATAFPDYGFAATLSIAYLVLSLIMIGLYHKFTSQTFRFETVGGKGSRQTPLQLGGWRWVGTAYCLAVWVLAFLIPFIGVLLNSLATTTGRVPGITVPLSQITLEAYVKFLTLQSTAQVIENTIILAVWGAIAVTTLSTFISYTSYKTNYSFARIGDYVSTMPLGIPLIVYSVAVLWMVLITPGLNMTYGTMFPLVLAYTVAKIPHGTRMISSNIIQISDQLEESSRIGGWSWWHSFKNIVVPLLAGGLSNTFLYTLIEGLKELTAIVLLLVGGNMVFTGLILTQFEQSPSTLPTVAAGSILFAFVLSILIAVQSQVERVRKF